jgi:hypothetical protein
LPRWINGKISICWNPPHITFTGKAGGKLLFAAVQADLDVRYCSRDGAACAEFSWEGSDDNIHASGRGWAAPAASSGTSSSIRVTTQGSSLNASNSFNSLLSPSVKFEAHPPPIVR